MKRNVFRETLIRLAEEEGVFAERERAANLKAARNLLELGTPIDTITQAIGLTADEIHVQA